MWKTVKNNVNAEQQTKFVSHFGILLYGRDLMHRVHILFSQAACVAVGVSALCTPIQVSAQGGVAEHAAAQRSTSSSASPDVPPIPQWVQNKSEDSATPTMPVLRTPPPGGNSLGSNAADQDRQGQQIDRYEQGDRPARWSSHFDARDAANETLPWDQQQYLHPSQARQPWVSSRPGAPSSAFQRFVLDTTGTYLPVFGHSLFDTSRMSRFSANQSAPAPADYVIGPDDEVTLRVWGSVEGDLNLTVDRNGQITIPKVGVVTVAGVRASQLEAVLRRAIGRNFSGFDASASLRKLRSIQVYVVGQAARPGAYTVSSMSTIVNALFESGGVGPNGSMRRVELRRRGALVGIVDLYKFITQGKSDGDRSLLPGDVIVIPPSGPRVALLGALDSPAIYELKDKKETLRDVLGYAGGTSALTSTDKVTIERVDSATLMTPARSVESHALDAAGLATIIKDGDVISLQKINPSFKNAVTLRGNVAASLRYPYREGMHLSDLLPEPAALLTPDYFKRKNVLVQIDKPDRRRSISIADQTRHVQALIDEPNWRYAVIERMDVLKLTTRLLPFNLGAVVNKTDPTQDLALEPGDIVTIFGSKDMRLPREDHTRLVRVDGEVRAAGVYELLPGESMQALLVRAGGVTSAAYLYGAEFTREQTRKQQEANLLEALNRMEQQSSTRMASLMANTNQSGNNEALISQFAKQQQVQIARLRNLKPSGRVSLELRMDAQTIEDLPDLPLDNGDTLYIPPLPAFVTVVGAVNNENAIIWREGRTVDEVLKVAGVQKDIADTSRSFVLRADGSVFSRDSTSWHNSFESVKLMPGDTVVVPEKIDPRTTMTKFMAGLKDWSQVISQLGLGVAAIRVLNR